MFPWLNHCYGCCIAASVAIGNPKRHVRKASHCGSNQQYSSHAMITLLIYCLFVPHICMVLFFMCIPFMVNHTFNATPPERLQQHPLLFTTNCNDCTFFLWRLHMAQPPHPGHSIILLRSKILSGMCAKLHTVAASNNRVRMPWWLLYYCLFKPHICMVLFFVNIPFVVNQHIQRNATGEVATLAWLVLLVKQWFSHTLKSHMQLPSIFCVALSSVSVTPLCASWYLKTYSYATCDVILLLLLIVMHDVSAVGLAERKEVNVKDKPET